MKTPALGNSRLFLVLAAALAFAACEGDEDPPATSDVGNTDAGEDVATIDTGDVSTLDTEDSSRFDIEETGDTPTTGGCNSSDDCQIGEICVDLLPGPDNGFCTTRCQDDTQCPDELDCVVIGDDELSYSACVEVDFCLDGDEDGYGVGPGCLGNDCDDTEASINPGADEVCNGTDDDCDDEVDNNTVEEREDCETGFAGVCNEGRIACISGLTECVARFEASAEICDDLDNDCDGELDEDATDAVEWYRDQDTDRYGRDDDVVVACEEPPGYVGVGGDCNDGNRGISPAANEVCDDIDNDCNGSIDGPDSLDAVTVYEDSDHDGFGNPAVSRLGCPDEDWVTNADDCNDEVVNEEGSSGAIAFYRDADEDRYGNPDDVVWACEAPEGYVANGDDCNDESEISYPGAREVCDGLDNNCVGGIDELVQSRFYRDIDNDERGDPTISVLGCEAPDGYTDNPNDCNDREPRAWTDRPEICDGVDNNCVGGIDEGVAETYYRDFDGDGYGDPTVSTTGCEVPGGYVENAGDCNDREREAWTGRAEICDDIDNDCVGGADDGLDTTWYIDLDGDGRGNPLVSTIACEPPTNFVDNDNDCNDSEREAWTGRAELCDGIDNNCVGGIDEGVGTTYYRDFDGDGYGDPTRPTVACEEPDRHSLNNLDCNDDSTLESPDEVEICGDGLDNDCVDGDAPCD